jgi:type I restriction enzyme S subunit
MLNELLIPQIRFPDFIDFWSKTTGGSVCNSIVPGRNKPTRFDGEIPWITLPDLQDQLFISKSKENLKLHKEDIKKIGSKVVPEGSVIMSCIGELGVSAVTTCDVVLNQQLHAFLPSDFINNVFLKYMIENQKKYFYRHATKTSVLYLNKENCNSLPLIIPSVVEQQKIAGFLSTVEKKISLLKDKHALLELYKKGVMQKIFSQEIRFQDEKGNDFSDWKELEFNEFISSRTEFPSPDDDVPLSSLTIKNGIEAKSARYVRDFLVTDDKDAYKLVYPEDFVANPMNLRFGAIAKNHSHLKVKISKYYDVFSCDNSIDNDFFELYLLSSEMRKKYHQTAIGTLEEKKRVHFSEFIHFQKKLPSKAEQMKISAFDKSLKKKILLLKQQIEHIQTFKNGLLQQMFV